MISSICASAWCKVHAIFREEGERETYEVPVVLWASSGDTVYGIINSNNGLVRADQEDGFRYYKVQQVHVGEAP